MQIPTYIINLPTSSARKQYMTDLLSAYPFLEISFVPAINGRKMTEEERNDRFDFGSSLKHYGRKLNEGEVGCALSHRLCYERLLVSESKYALVLEDDISIIRDLNEIPAEGIDAVLDSEKPRILFLSGDYWMYSKKNVTPVYDAVGGYAYFVNRAAAELILSITKPFSVADDWMVYKRKGAGLFAVYPYMIDANLEIDKLVSDVQQYSWSNNRSLMSKTEVIKSVVPGIVRRCMKLVGMFESKVRVMDNVVVG